MRLLRGVREVRPFSDGRSGSWTIFAAQAALAIENARLFSETQEALQRQTASADVLQVISSSPGQLDPVFRAILENATRLCDAQFGNLFRVDGKAVHFAAEVGAPPEFGEYLRRPGPLQYPPGGMIERVLRAKQVMHTMDYAADEVAGMAARLGGARSTLGVPMLKDGALVGVIIIYRLEVRPFTDKQIELIENFAAQAVIAIENTRLLTEQREALEQQTATADVLQIISSSPGELEPVFEAVLENATRICDAGFGTILRHDGNVFYFAADIGTSPELAEYLRQPGPFRGVPGGMADRIQRTRQLQHSVDYSTDAAPGIAATLGGARSTLGVPILKDDVLLGALVIYRKEVRPFSQREIALVQSFAAQAAIAIENARLINETREALERQTATADVLKVIASSPTDVQPVFEAIAERSNRLLGGYSTAVLRFDGEVLDLAAYTSTNPDGDAALRAAFPQPVANFPPFLLVRGGETVQFTDTEAVGVPVLNRDLARARGYRSMVHTALMGDGGAIGMISVTRKEPGDFAPHHVQLLRTFADQAVIAIQNVKLFDEVQARTRDLSESLQQQTATADVLKVISRSTFDLQTVLDTLVESAARLCEADRAFIFQRSDGVYKQAANFGFSRDFEEFARQNPILPERGTITGRVAVEGKTIHVADVLADPEFTGFQYQSRASFRSCLGVPLLRAGEVIGVFFLSRSEVNPFSGKQIELITTFADQAVIAIQNVRLFEEVQAKTRDLEEALVYQTGSANILKVIASSPTNVQPVLQAIAETACELCAATDGQVLLRVGDELRFSAHHGSIPVAFETKLINRNWVNGRAVIDKTTVHAHDLLSTEGDEFPEGRDMALRHMGRTVLSVPLLRDNEAIGTIALRRAEAQPFSDKQIALLQTFADQAVIAIGNTRLFEEVQAKTRELTESLQQQTATADVLKVISRSAFDLEFGNEHADTFGCRTVQVGGERTVSSRRRGSCCAWRC